MRHHKSGSYIPLIIASVLLTFALSLSVPDPASAGGKASEDYVIGPQDVLKIVVWENEDLSGMVAVTLDGYINYHLIGKIKASGLTTGELADKITALLANGYIVNPQVTVEVVKYMSKKIFIIGEVKKPGTYYLTRKTTLVEAISMAGGTTDNADREVIIVRPDKHRKSAVNRAKQPLSQAEGGRQIKVDLRSAVEGDLTQNIFVHDGDSIFIPKAKSFFIMGEVKSPGRYKLEKGTTILKAISIAGGETEKAAKNRTKVIRNIKGEKFERKVSLDELVRSEDIIIVPESFF